MNQPNTKESFSQNVDRKRIVEAVRGHDTAMLITRDPDGAPRGRPMAILSVESSGRMWFVTREQTGKIHEIAMDDSVAVTLQSKSNFISFTGAARITRDVARAKELWTPMLEVWFPEGPEDPELALISFNPERAELWETGTRETIRFLFEATKAFVKGESIDPPESAHTRAQMN